MNLYYSVYQSWMLIQEAFLYFTNEFLYLRKDEVQKRNASDLGERKNKFINKVYINTAFTSAKANIYNLMPDIS